MKTVQLFLLFKAAEKKLFDDIFAFICHIVFSTRPLFEVNASFLSSNQNIGKFNFQAKLATTEMFLRFFCGSPETLRLSVFFPTASTAPAS